MWVLGTVSCVVLSFLNQFFWHRNEPLSITSISTLIAVVPLGHLMASALPDRVLFKGSRWEFALNPGPFDVKEPVLITIFANSGAGNVYAVHIISAVKIFYKKHLTFFVSLIVIITTQLGSGMKGLGVAAIGLDWSSVSAYLNSSLASPWFATANIVVGFFLFMYVVTPLTYWSDVYNAKTFPMFSDGLFTSSGRKYNISSINNGSCHRLPASPISFSSSNGSHCDVRLAMPLFLSFLLQVFQGSGSSTVPLRHLSLLGLRTPACSCGGLPALTSASRLHEGPQKIDSGSHGPFFQALSIFLSYLHLLYGCDIGCWVQGKRGGGQIYDEELCSSLFLQAWIRLDGQLYLRTSIRGLIFSRVGLGPVSVRVR